MEPSNIAVCVPVFKRIEKVESLLESVEETSLGQVYIADDGEKTERKKDVYSRNWDFNLEVFDLEFDSGVGEKRQVLAKKPEEEYLLFIDSDMKVPRNYKVLLRQLKSRQDLGGVCGMYLEKSRIWTVSTDFYEENGDLIRGIREEKEIEFLGGAPFVEFDFHPQVGLFKKECLMDYNWDDEYTIMREHVDFFLGHYKETSWNFGLSPQVYFRHYPGGDTDYESHRNSDLKHQKSDQYFCKKWGYDNLILETNAWIDTYNPTLESFPSYMGIRKNLKGLYRRTKTLGAATLDWVK